MRSKISKDDLEDKYIEKLEIVESEYQGRKVKLNDPFRLPSGSNKKFGVYVKNEKGKYTSTRRHGSKDLVNF